MTIRRKNLKHLEELMNVLGSPTLPTKHVNMLVALRNSWTAKQYLNDRELAMMRAVAEQFESIADMRVRETQQAEGHNELVDLHKAMEELEEKGLVIVAPKTRKRRKAKV